MPTEPETQRRSIFSDANFNQGCKLAIQILNSRKVEIIHAIGQCGEQPKADESKDLRKVSMLLAAIEVSLKADHDR